MVDPGPRHARREVGRDEDMVDTALAWKAVGALLAVAGCLLAVFETMIAKMRVFRVPEFVGIALMLGFLATLLRFVSQGL